MLRFMARFTMKPTRYTSTDETRRESTVEIEFEQREFLVSAQRCRRKDTQLWVIRHIYKAYCRYSRSHLRARRSLVRHEHVRDERPTLRRHDPAIQYWIDQEADPTARQIPPCPGQACTVSKNTAVTQRGISTNGPTHCPTHFTNTPTGNQKPRGPPKNSCQTCSGPIPNSNSKVALYIYKERLGDCLHAASLAYC